jgi:hypothetical protein
VRLTCRLFLLDNPGEFGERGRDAAMSACVAHDAITSAASCCHYLRSVGHEQWVDQPIPAG